MGKGSSKGHTPREAKDNLKSTQLLSVIDAISEGPVEGPVDGLKSVLLNGTPVLDSEGKTNFSGVTVVFRAGEQEQTPPEGFESSGSETVLGTEVKYDTPITRTITSANIDRLRLTFGVQALVETTSKGDRNPSEVRLLVQIQRNGGWVTEKDITIKGKTTSQYLASVVVGNLPPRPFNIRMRRMTPDSTTDQLQNKTLWSSYTEIIDVKQCYPNTALVGGTVVRRKVYARFLDAVNFVNGNSDADPEQEVISRWRIEQCSELSAVSASFVLATPTETDGAVFPGRIMLANTCMWTYRSDECGYTGRAVADEFDKPTTDIRKDKCSKCMRGCELRNNTGNFGGFLSINKLSQ
ncbi:host specificity protein [Shigella sonnei]|nr:host specificity protein [Shigella sonnei]